MQRLVSDLSSFPWDWIGEPLGIVSQEDLAAAFDGCANGRLSIEMLFTWATALECRDDVGFANAEVASAIHELANPDLQPANFIDELESKFRR
jgi:hypothetical protein